VKPAQQQYLRHLKLFGYIKPRPYFKKIEIGNLTMTLKYKHCKNKDFLLADNILVHFNYENFLPLDHNKRQSRFEQDIMKDMQQ
jgi:hypothetical protein